MISGILKRRVASLTALALILAGGGQATAAGRGCRAKVVEVRRTDVYLAKPAACPLADGARLRPARAGGARLEVVSTSSRFVLARPVGAQPIDRGDVFLPLKGTAARKAAAAETQQTGEAYKAGPGARSARPGESFWRAALAARAPTSSPGRTSAGPDATGWQVSGSLGAGGQATLDGSQRQRDYYRAFADSTLRLRLFGPLGFGYSHRLIWQRRFQYHRTSQPWDGDYPEFGVRELRLELYSLGDRLLISAGRMAPRGVGGARAVDGGIMEGALLPSLVVGAYGGLLPEPSSLAFSNTALGFGGYLRGRWVGAGARLGGSLHVGGSTFDGRRDELFADGLLNLRLGRWLSLTALSRLNFAGDFNPLERPAVDLTRLYASATSRPLGWLELGLRYSFTRWVPSRQTFARWGQAYGLSGAPLSALGISSTVSPLSGLRLSVEADLDLGDASAGPGVWCGLVAGYWLPGGRHRVELAYRLHDTDALLGHHARGSIRLGLLDALDLEVAYRFGRVAQTGPRLVIREHDLNLVVDWWIGWGLHAWLDATWMTGDDIEAGLFLARFGWRFR